MNQIDLQGPRCGHHRRRAGHRLAAAERMLKSGASVALWDIDAAKLAEAERRWPPWAWSAAWRWS